MANAARDLRGAALRQGRQQDRQCEDLDGEAERPGDSPESRTLDANRRRLARPGVGGRPADDSSGLRAGGVAECEGTRIAIQAMTLACPIRQRSGGHDAPRY